MCGRRTSSSPSGTSGPHQPGWQQFAQRHLSIDLRGLAALRLCLGLVLLVDLATRAPFLSTFYTGAGLTPPALTLETRTWYALLPHVLAGSFAAQGGLFLLAAACAAALLAGWRTRWAVLGCWLLTLSLHLRNPYVLDSGDKLLHLLLFWGLFLPMGARWSLDARSRRSAARATITSVGSAALLLQVALLYLCTGLLKLMHSEWRGGDAVEYVLRQRFWLRPAGEWFSQFSSILTGLTFAVLVVEVLAPVLLLWPVRTTAVRMVAMVTLLALQVGFGTTIELGLFPWIATTALLPFVWPTAWDHIEHAVFQRWPQAQPDHTFPPGPNGNLRDRPTFGGRTGSAVAATALVATLALNLDSFRPGTVVPTPVERAAEWVGLSQGWRMYASPGDTETRLRIDGTLVDGTAIVVADGQQAPRWDEMARLRSSYRAKIYLEWVADPNTETAWPILATWVCVRWNAARTPRELVAVSLSAVTTPLSLDDRPTTSATSELGRWPCEP